MLYESHTVLHGRPFPLQGRHYANVFVHFQPGKSIELYIYICRNLLLFTSLFLFLNSRYNKLLVISVVISLFTNQIDIRNRSICNQSI